MNQTIEDYVREIIRKHDLDCYAIFNSDVHLNEYILKRDMRVFCISGFSGSNGTVVISKEPCLITDARYYIQAQEESKFPLCKDKLHEHIVSKQYKKVSFDTKTISSSRFKKLMETFSENSIEFVETEFKFVIGLDENQHDDRPSEIVYLEQYNLKDYLHVSDESEGLEYDPVIREYLSSLGFNNIDGNVTGSRYQDKIERVRQAIGEKVLIVTELDTIGWILNLRGFDIEFNPVFFSFLVITKDEVLLFTDRPVVLDMVRVRPYCAFEEYLESIVERPAVISGDCNQFIYSKFKDVELTGTIRELQATKNEVELCGMALAYFFDGIALAELFGFIHNNSGLTEKTIADELHNIKTKFKGYIQPSFDSISSTGANAAIVHHRASLAKIDKSKVYLIDCGSQYYFGTTDTTRTLFFGPDIDEQLVHDYTLVLKGQLNAMMKEYNSESTCAEIDEISRSFLKKEEKDFGHSTGHGVGHFLCVHEHPPSVHGKSEDRLQPNMVFSVEPGYYKEGEYGIRIENLVASRKIGDTIKLVNITIVPYQNRMVNVSMLSEEEKVYYNSCNEKCIKTLQKYISYEAFEFLKNNSYKIE